MADNPKKTVNLQKGKDRLQNLAASMSPDQQLLSGLREEIAKALEAGATLKQVWLSLRESGFIGNQMKLSNWLHENGIRQKTAKAPSGSGKRSKKPENSNLQSQEKGHNEIEKPYTDVTQQKSEAKDNQTTTSSGDIPISDDNY